MGPTEIPVQFVSIHFLGDKLADEWSWSFTHFKIILKRDKTYISNSILGHIGELYCEIYF